MKYKPEESEVMDSLKGHMALKSSAYKPTVNKLSSQYLIQDQMASHYYNLATIKSAIDTSPPKSSSLSIKKRDQVKREALIKKIKSGNSTERQGRNLDNADYQNDDYNYDRLSPVQMDTSNRHGISYNDDDPYFNPNKTQNAGRGLTSRSWSGTGRYQGRDSKSQSARSMGRPFTAGHANTARGSGSRKEKQMNNSGPKPSAMDVTYSGDYLDKHSDRFKNSGEANFTPRTKKTKAKSFLSQSKHYAPPSLTPRKSKNSEKKNNKTITENDVKALDDKQGSERDEDHRRWIEEQSEFVQRLSLADQERTSPSPSRNSSRRWLDTTTLDKVYSKSSRSRSEKSDTIRRIEAEEEEFKYVDFINEITNDILSRGIYSDVVLDQTMERHVQRKRHELDENKMRKMLQKLKEDLGMSDDLPSRSNMLHTTNTLEDTRYSYKEDERKRYSASSSYGAKAKDRKSASSAPTVDEFQFKVSISGAEEEVDSGSYAGFSGLPSSSSRSTRRTKVVHPSPSITSISSIHSDRGSVRFGEQRTIAKHREEPVETSQTIKSASDPELINDAVQQEDEEASQPIPDAFSSDLDATLKESDAKSGSEELKTTTTASSVPPRGGEENSGKVKSSSEEEDEESDYESVAALSMALKPGVAPSQDPGTTLGSTAASKSEDAAAYSDDFDDDDF